jgi:nucleoside-diphosphate-sugar epimerase
MGGGQNAQSEERQGKALVDASLKKNGVEHFVYSSIDRGGSRSDRDPTNISHFISKHNIEQHLSSKAEGSSMSYTVLRPVAFFEDLMPNFIGKVFSTSWETTLR